MTSLASIGPGSYVTHFGSWKEAIVAFCDDRNKARGEEEACGDGSTECDSAFVEHATALTESDVVSEPHPHYQGRTLNFRAFTYAPTCEHDVVQMFGAVAHELGFEIIGNRSAVS